jgi:hypothetical protein
VEDLRDGLPSCEARRQAGLPALPKISIPHYEAFFQPSSRSADIFL